jgi:ABC-type glycerol-3-phosphate transport system substrate-binding protein
MTDMAKAISRVGLALIMAAAGIAATHAASNAEPAAHQVTYTVTTGSELNAQIYYMKVEPPSQAAFNADSSPFLVNDNRVLVSPDSPWAFQTTMNDPNQWAIVSASGVLRTDPQFHCQIAVDGVTVVSQDGGSGVQCALRPW